MTVRLMQAPLPWLPEGATEIAPGVGLASGDDGSGTVWRWADAYRRDGLAGLLPEPKGPRGPSKLTPELTAEIRELRGQGLSQAAVAARCGVSSFAVRTALGTVGSRTPPAAAGAEPAGQEARAGGDGREQEALPVLPDPVPRDGERALARFGLLGEGAVPAVTPGARDPLEGRRE